MALEPVLDVLNRINPLNSTKWSSIKINIIFYLNNKCLLQ